MKYHNRCLLVVNKKILFAENRPRQANKLQDLLKFNGYEVDIVILRHKIIQKVETFAPDLIIMDIRWGASYSTWGIDTVLELQQRQINTPIIGFSSA